VLLGILPKVNRKTLTLVIFQLFSNIVAFCSEARHWASFRALFKAKTLAAKWGAVEIFAHPSMSFAHPSMSFAHPSMSFAHQV